jgi:hypothetical protein
MAGTYEISSPPKKKSGNEGLWSCEEGRMSLSDLRSAAGGVIFFLAGATTAVADTANEAFVRAVRSIQLAEATSTKQEELTHLEDAVQAFDLIIQV